MLKMVRSHARLSAILLLIQIVPLCFCSSPLEVPAYPLLQHANGSEVYGCPQSSLNLKLMQYAPDAEPDPTHALLLPVQVLMDRVEAYTGEGSFERSIALNAGALIILLPESFEASPRWSAVEHALLSHRFSIPVLFVSHSEEVQEMLVGFGSYNGTTESSSVLDLVLRNDFIVMNKAKAPSTPKTYDSTTFTAWSGGSSASPENPTIAFVANYDSFAAASQLSFGANSNAAGVAAVLELARLLHRLYSTGIHAQSRYNLVFVLTTSGASFDGVSNWLNSAGEKLLSSIEVAICLDSLASSNAAEPLYVHTSRPHKDAVAKRVYDAFRNAGDLVGRPVQVQQKKVNMAEAAVPWEHELFSIKHILGITLSSHSSPPPQYGRSSVLDSRNNLDMEQLKKNVELLAEAVGHLMYEVEESARIFTGSLSVSTHNIARWLEQAGGAPHDLPHLQASPALTRAIEEELVRFADDVSTKTVSSKHKFSYVPPGSLTFAVVKPIFFDVAVFLLCCAFLYGIHLVLYMS